MRFGSKRRKCRGAKAVLPVTKMPPEMGKTCFACNINLTKNRQNPFCPSTKKLPERAKTIMVVRYKKAAQYLKSNKNRVF